MGMSSGNELGMNKDVFALSGEIMVGLRRFELLSIAPEATSLDQASRQPQMAAHVCLCRIHS